MIIQPRVLADQRGFFFESFRASEFSKHGVSTLFAQDNYSKSSLGVLRGLHFQNEPHAQGKLVQVLQGAVWDVAVDLRPGSSTFGRWHGLELSQANRTMLWIPPGFAHGFLALQEGSEVAYKCTVEYNPDSEGGYRWDDPAFAIAWPRMDVAPKISEKDMLLPYFTPPRKKA